MIELRYDPVEQGVRISFVAHDGNEKYHQFEAAESENAGLGLRVCEQTPEKLTLLQEIIAAEIANATQS
jgi:hypothetical protein